MKKSFRLSAAVAICCLAFSGAAFAQDEDSDFRQAFVDEMWTHGDVVGFISTEREIAMIVMGHEGTVARHHPDLDFSTLLIQHFATSTELAFAVATIEPMPGDTATYVKSECQRRTKPCAGCTNVGTGSKKEVAVGADYGVCERIEEVTTSCKTTFKKVCTLYTYTEPNCPGSGTTSDVNGWNCK
ncbi:MAG TPA: hypothetical protein VLT87_15440 [Thermoanaerobaculia bacterium]|nr:hypothetical protein [Thermoanaerobaculia bacterium]HSN87161.1 hypothetical protein [Thermoanaerobaculia bacterium]